MQRKWSFIAVALVVLSAVSVFSVIELSDTGADPVTDDSNKVVYNANVTGNRLFNIMINENYFELVDPEHTVEWSYAVGDPSGTLDYQSFDLGVPVDANHFTFEVEQVMSGESEVVGKYELTVSSMESAQVTLTLRYVIDHRYGDGNEMITEPLYLIYNMALNGHATLPTDLEYVVNFGGTEYNLTSAQGFHFEQGVHTKLTPIIKNGETVLNNSDYTWYAFNLPDGMASTSKGEIAGVPTKFSTTDNAQIMIQDKYNNSKVFTISHYVYAHTGSYNVEFFLKNGSVSNGESVNSMSFMPSEFHTQRERTVSLSVLKMDDADDYEVEVISNDSTNGYRERKDPISTCSLSNRDGVPQDALVFELPTEGTGMYKVNLYKDVEGTMTFVYTFDLYVLSKVLAVEAAIIVGSESTS